MAIDSTIVCMVCHKQKFVTHSASAMTPDVCGECQEIIAENERTQHLADLAKLTVEERLARIEAALYDMPKHSGFDWNAPIG